MAVVALIVFDQGGAGTPGEAFEGTIAGGLVTITNNVNTSITSWAVTLLDVPPDSALVPGVLATAVSNTPTATFTPDVPGSYRIQLYVTDGSATNTDIRNFGVRNARNILVPPYQQVPAPLPLSGVGSKPDEQNYGGQTRGWTGDRTDGQLEEFFSTYDDLPYRTVTTTPFTALVTHQQPFYYVDLATVGGNAIFNLPSSARVGQRFRVTAKAGSAYQLRVVTPGGHNIDGQATRVLSSGTSNEFVYLGGVAWTNLNASQPWNVYPSGDTTGATDRATWQAIVGVGETARPAPGTYYMSAPLIPTSGSKILGVKGVVVKRGSVWANAAGTDPLNAFITLLEVEAAQAATTVAVTAVMDSPTITVTSATGFVALGFFKIGGTSGAQDFYGASNGPMAKSEEVLRITSMAGAVVTLDEPTWLHHGANGATKPAKLLTSIVDGFTCENVRFDAYSTTVGEAISGAIYATFARRVVVEGCSFKGFTGKAVFLRGSKHCLVTDLVDLGANNCLVDMQSCQSTIVRDVFESHEVKLRVNTLGGGKPLYHFSWSSQCRAVQYINCTTVDACGAFRTWGGVACHLVNCHSVRPNIEALIADQAGLGTNEYGVRGWALDSGPNLVDVVFGLAEFGFGCTFQLRDDGGSIGAASHFFGSDSPQLWHQAFYLHDHYKTKIDLHTSNNGNEAVSATRKRYAAALAQDFEAVSGTIHAEGTYAGVAVYATFGVLYNVDITHHPRCGAGFSLGLYSLYLASNLPPRIRSLRSLDCEQPILMGPVTDADALYNEPIVDIAYANFSYIIANGQERVARNVVYARRPDSAAAPVAGVAYALDPAGTANRRDCTTANAVAGEPAVVCLSIPAVTHQGVQRHFAGVQVGPGATFPILALGALQPGPLQLDANGKAVALTSIVSGEMARCIGNNSRRTTGAALLQVGQ